MTLSETDCPNCGKVVAASASTCPYCRASLQMSTFEDLEALAEEMLSKERTPPPRPEPKPEPIKSVPQISKPEPERSKPEPPKAESAPATPEMKPAESKPAPAPEPPAEEKKGLGRLFGKKKK